MKTKHIYTIDTLLIVGTLFGLFFAFSYAAPILNSPFDGAVATGAVLFSFEKADVILIDDNIDFSSPQKYYAEDNLVINLKPGVYYWRVENDIEKSEARQLTIQSEIDLKLKKIENSESYEIINAGNERLNVDIYEFGKLTGQIVLDSGEEKNATGNKFIGGQDG